MLVYAALILACVWSLVSAGDFTLGRKPWQNLMTTAGELSRPSFVDLWFGNTQLEYKSDDGQVLRVENQRASEAKFLSGLGSAIWTTLKIATLGSLLAAILGAPLGFLSAKNMHAPVAVAWLARRVLDICRSIHTLVFGLLIVGIIGLGPMAGILAIALHSMGTWGKLYAESIETLDMRPIEAVRATGASPVQVFLFAVWPALLPNFISNHLYIWEYNIRDSTVLGLIGAGGLGLLVSEAVSLFQWGRLATLLIAIVLMVVAFDALSRRIRAAVL
ncbi:MAG: phosphonate ABC transporter, permease protein PhnE [Betaproteobacteria bacterium]|nr:phosphonate ABC transporter, permease protein PhnE [Betaproteobacteria bacterium]